MYSETLENFIASPPLSGIHYIVCVAFILVCWIDSGWYPGRQDDRYDSAPLHFFSIIFIQKASHCSICNIYSIIGENNI